jgi:hypothetical protein
MGSTLDSCLNCTAPISHSPGPNERASVLWHRATMIRATSPSIIGSIMSSVLGERHGVVFSTLLKHLVPSLDCTA